MTTLILLLPCTKLPDPTIFVTADSVSDNVTLFIFGRTVNGTPHQTAEAYVPMTLPFSNVVQTIVPCQAPEFGTSFA